MDRIKAMQTFVRIVEAGSFTRAAETLDLPRASLTATMQNLEAYLGTQLLLRTTRSISLTTDGAAYYAQCVEILAAVEAAEAPYRGSAGSPQGACAWHCPAPSAAGWWCRASANSTPSIQASNWWCRSATASPT